MWSFTFIVKNKFFVFLNTNFFNFLIELSVQIWEKYWKNNILKSPHAPNYWCSSLAQEVRIVQDHLYNYMDFYLIDVRQLTPFSHVQESNLEREILTTSGGPTMDDPTHNHERWNMGSDTMLTWT